MTAVHKKLLPKEIDIHALVQELVGTYKPVRIYLFGSRVRGDFRESSDYDCMVVVPDNTPPESRTTQQKPAAAKGIWLDLKVWTQTYFDRQLHLKASMPATIVREGILLYERNERSDLPSNLKTGSLVQEEPGEYDPVRIENTREWLKRAKRDLRMAELALGEVREFLNESLFHSQQAVEKSVKAFLTWHDCPPQKIHDLSELRACCVSIDPALQSALKPAPDLSNWCVHGRYPNEAPPPTEEQAEDGLRIARNVLTAVLDRMPRCIHDVLE